MDKRLLSLLLVIPLLIFCTTPTPEPDPDPEPEPDPVVDGDAYENAAPQVKNGDVILVTNPNVEKFLTEVDYPDKDMSYTKIFDYYGGFNGKKYNEAGQEDPSGIAFDWSHMPTSDKPQTYSIRWKEADLDGSAIKVHLEDKLSWSADMDVAFDAVYHDIFNLLPNDEYTFKVTTENGKVLTEGKFTTTGHVHQCFFTNNKKRTSGVRNCRDLGGWKTIDGKTVKYRKIYRGGRMNDPWETMLSKTGRQEVQMEGIAAQLELRGSDDYVNKPAISTFAHCAPVIEEGGKVMLGVTKPSAKNCAKWLKFDQGREDIEDVSKYTPTAEEYDAFQVAYKGKTKQCFEFVLDCVRNNKPVYFHCSLGRDRTGTMGIILLGVLGVKEGDISKEYELTYFAPVGYSVSSSDKATNPEPIYKNDRTHWVYSDVTPYFWSKATDGTFASGVENYLVNVAGVPQADIDEFRRLMLE